MYDVEQVSYHVITIRVAALRSISLLPPRANQPAALIARPTVLKPNAKRRHEMQATAMPASLRVMSSIGCERREVPQGPQKRKRNSPENFDSPARRQKAEKDEPTNDERTYSDALVHMSLAEALTELEGSKFPEIEANAVERLRQFVETNGGLPVERDCHSVEILEVGDDDMRETVLPLCRWVVGLTTHLQGRVLVGVSGSAGAGKSTLAQMLSAACNPLSGRDNFSQTVSMDAYSYPNAHLSAQPAEDHLGRACTLKDVKGQPKTLDCASFLRDLERLRRPSAQPILLPAYSRQLHDPVPDCVTVAPECRLVIVEGLHLLHQEGLWKDVYVTLHRSVFLDIERSCCFERVVGRKVANGRSRESSEAHFDRVDGPIWDQLQEEKTLANLVLAIRPTQDRHLNVSDIVTHKKQDECFHVSETRWENYNVGAYPEECQEMDIGSSQEAGPSVSPESLWVSWNSTGEKF